MNAEIVSLLNITKGKTFLRENNEIYSNWGSKHTYCRKNYVRRYGLIKNWSLRAFLKQCRSYNCIPIFFIYR